MNIKEVFERCNDGDFVKDNYKRKWKVDKGDLICDCGDINNFYTLKQIMELDFKKDYNVDWDKVEVDTKILVSNDYIRWYRRYFAEFKNDKIYTFDNGTTSFTYSYTGLVPWEYAKIYKEEK